MTNQARLEQLLQQIHAAQELAGEGMTVQLTGS